MDDNRLKEPPIVATMVASPVVALHVADPSVYIVTWAFVSRIDCKLMHAVTCWGRGVCASRGRCVRQLLHRALGGRASALAAKIVAYGRVKKGVMGMI